MGGVHLVNETRRDKIVIVFTVVWVPLPAAYYREIVRLAPGEEKWVPTFGGHANVFAWPSTGDAGKDRLIMDTLGKVFVAFNVVRAGVNVFGGFAFDWAEIFGVAFGEGLIAAVLDFFVGLVVDMVMDGIITGAADGALELVLRRAKGIIKKGVRSHQPRHPVTIRNCFVTNTLGLISARTVKLLESRGGADFEVHKVEAWKVWERNFAFVGRLV